MDMAIEMVRRGLIKSGMYPLGTGTVGGKSIEFVSYPWQAGRELFILVRKKNQSQTTECIEVERIKL